MEPRKEELNKTPEPRTQAMKCRFQIVKLDERIAPKDFCWSCYPKGRAWGRHK